VSSAFIEALQFLILLIQPLFVVSTDIEEIQMWLQRQDRWCRRYFMVFGKLTNPPVLSVQMGVG